MTVLVILQILTALYLVYSTVKATIYFKRNKKTWENFYWLVLIIALLCSFFIIDSATAKDALTNRYFVLLPPIIYSTIFLYWTKKLKERSTV